MRETARLLDLVVAALTQRGYRYTILGYPPGDSRSIDVVAWGSQGRILIRVTGDASNLSPSSVKELTALAYSLDAFPIIVSSRNSGIPLEDLLIYERYSVPVVTPQTLEEALVQDGFYVFYKRGEYYVKLNAEKMRERRLEKGYSLGDLARDLGVSRKAVYEYERGTIDPTATVAERLIRILGDDIVRPVNLFRKPEESQASGQPRPHSRREEELISELRSMEFRVAHSARSPLDVAASRDKESLTIVVRHGRDVKLYERSVEVLEIARTLRAEAVALIDDEVKRGTARDLEGAGLKVYTLEEFKERLRRNEGHSDNG